MTTERQYPRYHGLHKHIDKEGGYAFWVPAGWHRTDMDAGYHGVIYSPHADGIETSFSAQKNLLKYSVDQDDLATLREGFQQGLDSLPGVEVEWQNETVTSTLITLEARFTFLEEETRRKRWTRVVYWGNGQLVLTAQGATPEEYEYWLPMFYNTMVTVEL